MSPWEPGQRLLGNLYIIILGTLTTFTWKTWEPCREPWRNLEGTFWGPFGNLLGTLREPCGTLGTFGTLGTLREPWEPLLGNLYLGTFNWEPLLGNLYLGTWEPGNLYLGTFNWEPLLGNLGTFTWEPLLGTWEPWGNGFWSCSGLLRNLYYGGRPQSFCCWRKKQKTTAKFSMEPKWVPKVDFLVGYGHKYVCHWKFRGSTLQWSNLAMMGNKWKISLLYTVFAKKKYARK